MQRSGLLLLMMLVLSAALLQAQRAGGGPRGGGLMRDGHGIRTGPSNGFLSGQSGFGRDRGYGGFWLPWYSPYWDWDDDGYFRNEPSYQQPISTTSPQVIVVEAKNPQPPAPLPEPPKLIAVPTSKGNSFLPIAAAMVSIIWGGHTDSINVSARLPKRLPLARALRRPAQSVRIWPHPTGSEQDGFRHFCLVSQTHTTYVQH